MNEKERVLGEYFAGLAAEAEAELLESLSVEDLKAKAKEAEIVGYSKMKKDELIEALSS